MIPTIEVLKTQAKDLRARATTDSPISHAQALEQVAHGYGYRDWNTLRAAAAQVIRNIPVVEGDRVQGLYLGQPFEATVLQVIPQEEGDMFRITMHFDEAVDVVTHKSFSNFRQRVTGNIDVRGQSREKTSNGQPQIVLHLSQGPAQ